eukprot:CAMPEP_0201565858 /NCGR_PEP_ID=MMETSP0190_2-20130828/5273_1 /ASSEMBLY_ACC=CAM_ASM_000263 /TAXON_ID=37353 /ORGANISM="Rosalina sp." /LENGTH=30 /DNA_ID= /DNA_START= /DNA_END= /DNA_ORIENTATION=
MKNGKNIHQIYIVMDVHVHHVLSILIFIGI